MSVLFENINLSKGSKKILQNRRMAADLAAAIRDDLDINPSFFPPNATRTFSRMNDQQLVEWFLGELDNIEQRGYDGVTYSTDGKDNEWIVQKYIKGAHDWEDITGKLNQQLYNFYLLKRYNKLEPKHQNLPQFNGIKDLGRYMVQYYSNELKNLEDEVRLEMLKKKARSIKLVDNDDYRVYITLNRAANQLLGKGSTWCTTNSGTDNHWRHYSDQAMLFQLIPKNAEHVKLDKAGRQISGNEKYQFGADAGMSFMDIADHKYPAQIVSQRFPYLGSDIISALNDKKKELNDYIAELNKDPAMQDPSVKVPPYRIENEIQKLKQFQNMGYFTNQVRPKPEELVQPTASTEQPQQALPNPEQPAQPAQPAQPNQGNNIMEKADKDVVAMLRNLQKYDALSRSKLTEGIVGSGIKSVDEMFQYDKPQDGQMPPWTGNRNTSRPPQDILGRRPEGGIAQYGDEYRRLKTGPGGPVTDRLRDYYALGGPKHPLPEDDMEEGNKFSGARQDAIDAGQTEFEVDGEKFAVSEEEDNLPLEANQPNMEGAYMEEVVCETCKCDPCACPDQEIMEWLQRFNRLG